MSNDQRTRHSAGKTGLAQAAFESETQMMQFIYNAILQAEAKKHTIDLFVRLRHSSSAQVPAGRRIFFCSDCIETYHAPFHLYWANDRACESCNGKGRSLRSVVVDSPNVRARLLGGLPDECDRCADPVYDLRDSFFNIYMLVCAKCVRGEKAEQYGSVTRLEDSLVIIDEAHAVPNEVWDAMETRKPVGGTFQIVSGDKVSPPINHDATKEEIDAAIANLTANAEEAN